MLTKFVIFSVVVGSSLALFLVWDRTHRGPVVPTDTLPLEWSFDRVPVGFAALPEAPVDNHLTAAKVGLGRRLFFDPILSGDKTVSCASCHQPDFGFASPDRLAVGILGRPSRRHAPTLINRAYGTSFSWDGRDNSLEGQIIGPLENDSEMGSNVATVMKRLRADETYVSLFREAFQDETGAETVDEWVTEQNLFFAIACFERTLLSGNSAVDRFRAADFGALSTSARQGLWIFESRGGCWKCHSGENFSDEDFHNTGIGFGQPERDAGRFEFTENPSDRFKFKTPTLRDVQHTAPYMHDGSLGSLRDVVEFYNRGGNRDDRDLDPKLKPLNLNAAEVGFLVDFLQALSGEPF